MNSEIQGGLGESFPSKEQKVKIREPCCSKSKHLQKFDFFFFLKTEMIEFLLINLYNNPRNQASFL